MKNKKVLLIIIAAAVVLVGVMLLLIFIPKGGGEDSDTDPATFDEVLEDMKQRDYNDTHRPVAPLRQAEDAVLVDTTELDYNGSVAAILAVIKEKIG